ncbi:MAG TPA: FecR domain-containing protein [Opitutaceae bacterium]|nr:FecR domain-containing protein [Opitutaceae bacterium]
MSSEPHQPIPAAALDAAAAWLARRDRGLTAAEQDDYLQWLQADPRHGEALSRHAAALERMMQLYEWTPSHGTEPNPDLFKKTRSASALGWLRAHRALAAGFAAAAVVALAALVTWPRAEPPAVSAGAGMPAPAPHSYLRVNERMALPDGTRVELNDGTKLVVQYSASERRVRLEGGEAHFSVWKDKARPFVVEAAGVEVRAVGTAFNVRLEAGRVEVLVTEGRVAVAPPSPAGTPPGNRPAGMDGGREPSPLVIAVGEQAVVPLADATTPVVTEVTVEDIARQLAWQAPRLQFHETPLADAVAEFNRLNRHQLELAEPALGAWRIGGTFRPDNVDGFVRLLDETLGIRGEPAGEHRTVLRSRE